MYLEVFTPLLGNLSVRWHSGKATTHENYRVLSTLKVKITL